MLLYHLDGTPGFPLTNHWLYHFTDLGNLGVRIFFVISGFLITNLLIRERESSGRIDVARFFLRRTLRIFPAYYVFVACVLMALAIGLVTINPGDLRAAVTYTMNYHRGRGWSLSHTWSLAVEEQFYLLWPATLTLLGMARGRVAVLAAICLVPLIRTAELWLSDSSMEVGFRFETVADAIATGCALALWRGQLWQLRLFRERLQRWSYLWAPAVVLGVSVLPALTERNLFGLRYVYWGFFNLAGITLMNFAIAIFIDWTMRNAHGRFGRFLNSSAMVYLGTLSYSLYLWQQMFLTRGHVLHPLSSFPVNLLFALGFAGLSYHVVERPILRARPAWERLLLSAKGPA